ncbi:MAG: hypothetical protein PHS83_00980 [Clostridia bacterium]|jgi:hypothetical protein|nr:hypothetical protein [Clostridia bacterium]MDD4145673.1 hypothetical protein [Clostridia bacterium]MDD4665159.1 hypothetical protein [Clostridia bacterium]
MPSHSLIKTRTDSTKKTMLILGIILTLSIIILGLGQGASVSLAFTFIDAH